MSGPARRRPDAERVDVPGGWPSPWRPHPALAAALVVVVVAFLLNVTPSMLIAIVVGTLLGIQTTVAVDRGRRAVEGLARSPGLDELARAVADALQETGLSPRGAEAVRVVPDGSGGHRCELDRVPAAVAALFTTALEEVVAPVAEPGYVVTRWVVAAPVDNAQGLRYALGLLRPDGEVRHGVPAVLRTTDERAQTFARAWERWVVTGTLAR